MIVDMLKITVKEECLSQAEAHIREQTAATRGDEGCVMARVMRAGGKPEEFYMLLAWENQEAIDKHLATEHDLKFRENMEDKIVCEPDFFEVFA